MDIKGKKLTSSTCMFNHITRKVQPQQLGGALIWLIGPFAELESMLQFESKGLMNSTIGHNSPWQPNQHTLSLLTGCRNGFGYLFGVIQ